MKNEESIIIERLNLINKIIESYNHADKYKSLKDENDKINKDIELLNKVRDNIRIYFKETEKETIKEISEVIR